MKILHLASFNRWSGAAAPAFAEADALREWGHEAHYAYVGGYLLEEKLGLIDWAHPVLTDGEDPVTVIRNVGAIRRLIDHERFDVVHSHLTHDHWLTALALMQRRSVSLVRTFHARRALKTDPLSRGLTRRTDALAVVSPVLSDHPALSGRLVTVTPSPVQPHFTPSGPAARQVYGIGPGTPVVGVIGKVSPRRGFEDAIETFARIRTGLPDAQLLVIGRGPHRPVLERLVSGLGLDESVVWAGYHEEQLPEHFRAMDLMLFTAAGSDEGHRAIVEAGACGTPVAAYPLSGVEYVLGERAAGHVSAERTPDSLALVARALLSRDGDGVRSEAVENARRFDYAATVDRLLTLYAMARPG